MKYKELRDLWIEENLAPIYEELDDSWRHGNRVFWVFEVDGRFWGVNFRVSGDGEYHSLRDCEYEGIADDEAVELVPREVTTVTYVEK